MLVGPLDEQRELESLLESAREERSAVLVLRGEAGIGKTALLEYAEAQAEDMRVLRCVGIEAEHELPFAGLQRLVRPCLDLIERLPAPQATALNSALGLSMDGVDDRFLVSLGALSLLAEAAEEAPLLCCIDDAQWLDTPSADALSFAARRLEAERIAMLFAAREGDLRSFDAPGVPELALAALADEEARALLTDHLERGPSGEVLATLLEHARGNPLALLELPAGLTDTQLDGAEPILGPPPVRPAVEGAFRARVAALPDGTRSLLLVAAADELGDLAAILDAGSRIGLDGSELGAAERGPSGTRSCVPPSIAPRAATSAGPRTRRSPTWSKTRRAAHGTARSWPIAPTKGLPPSSRRPGFRQPRAAGRPRPPQRSSAPQS